MLPYEVAPAVGRDDLILEHLPQVRLIAKRIHRGVPPSVKLEDLVSAGILGLIAAIDRYDASQDVKLRTYAEFKIRGAILDSLRTLDWAPRQQRKRAKVIESAIAALEQEYQRAPTEEEIADRLALSVEEYHDWLAGTHNLTVASLECARTEDAGTDLLELVGDSKEQWPSQLLERAELQKLVARAVARMPNLEKKVLSLYFYEEMTLREIGKILDVHESRASQLKAQAILRLRAHLENSWPDHGKVLKKNGQATALRT